MKVQSDERIEISDAMRRSLKQSSLSQAAYARSIGTSPARLHAYLAGKTIPSAAIYLRALRLGEALEEARDRGLMTPDETAEVVNRSLKEGNETWALRMILQARDDLRLAETEAPEVLPAWRTRANAIKDDRFDVLFRAIIAKEFGEAVPEWTANAKLDDEWIMQDPFRDEATIKRQTPEWLAKARIYIAERGLATA